MEGRPIMSEPDAYEDLEPTAIPDLDEPILDPDRIAATNHLDADAADLIEQALEVPEDEEEAAPDR
jgi:hypothetical protein